MPSGPLSAKLAAKASHLALSVAAIDGTSQPSTSLATRARAQPSGIYSNMLEAGAAAGGSAGEREDRQRRSSVATRGSAARPVSRRIIGPPLCFLAWVRYI